MNVVDWKTKLQDELISRSFVLALVFLIPLFFVELTEQNAKAYITLAGLALGTGIAKTVQNAVKANAAAKASAASTDQPKEQ